VTDERSAGSVRDTADGQALLETMRLSHFELLRPGELDALAKSFAQAGGPGAARPGGALAAPGAAAPAGSASGAASPGAAGR